jgi:hypothetical protein
MYLTLVRGNRKCARITGCQQCCPQNDKPLQKLRKQLSCFCIALTAIHGDDRAISMPVIDQDTRILSSTLQSKIRLLPLPKLKEVGRARRQA